PKSNATTPTAGGNFSFAKSSPSSGVNFPSRGFSSMDAPCAPPASTKSIARSLLKSVVTSPAPVAAAPRAVSVETSVNVLFPLLRHKKLCAAPPAESDSAAIVAYQSKSPLYPNSTTNASPHPLCPPPKKAPASHLHQNQKSMHPCSPQLPQRPRRSSKQTDSPPPQNARQSPPILPLQRSTAIPPSNISPDLHSQRRMASPNAPT